MAVEQCSEELDYLATIQDKLSTRPGTEPECRYEWWLGKLQGMLGYLITVVEEEG
jgi:hypothetical protein